MNELIESIFADFTVDGVNIPVEFMFYEGHDEPYIVYMNVDMDNSLSADDDLVGYVTYYDFDVYSKGNYNNIISSVKALLKQNGFIWQPSRSSQDLFDVETGYYHKTLCFAYLKEEENNG